METSLHKYFSLIGDPRIHRNKKHLLAGIIILTIIAVICGAESWDSIELFGKAKIKFLRTFLKLPNGIPSHDTINRVFSMLSPTRFERLFAEWANSLKDKGIDLELIAIDAMGAQTKIVENGGGYILALKGNQKGLREEVENVFRVQGPGSTDEVAEKGHGRVAQNFSLINKIALNILKKDKRKGSIKSKRLKAGWDNRFLTKLLIN
ncbi:MAG: ISAs1 family transposase [Chlorobi bacterium]|nr:ISAs1 family transposase [Chlorobiota bacterium]